MSNSPSRYSSKRVKRIPQSGIRSDRYQFLGLDQAEPDLGDPNVGPSSVGANPYTGLIRDAYILVSDDSNNGKRYWLNQQNIISGGVVTPGSVTIRDTGVIKGLANQITDLNFIGSGVTIVSPGSFSGAGLSSVDISISVSDVSVNSGNTNSVIYRDNTKLAQAAPNFYYNPSTSRVGIGTSLPTQLLDVSGDATVSGILTTNRLFSKEFRVGKLTIDETAFSSFSSDTIGIGTTLARSNLDVIGSAIISGDVSIGGISTIPRLFSQNIVVSSASSFGSISIGNTQVFSSDRQLQNITSIDSVTKNTIDLAIRTTPNSFDDLAVVGLTTLSTVLITGIATTKDFNVTGIATISSLQVSNLRVVGFATISSLGVSGLTTTQNLNVLGIATVNTLGVSGLTTTRNLNVVGMATIANISVGASIGIGTTVARYNLDVNGTTRLLNGLILYDTDLQEYNPGAVGEVLLSQGAALPPRWGSSDQVNTGSATAVSTVDRNGIDRDYYVTFVQNTSGNQSIFLDSSGAILYNPFKDQLSVNSLVVNDIQLTGLNRQTVGVVTTTNKNEVILDILDTSQFRSARYTVQVNSIGQLVLNSDVSVGISSSGRNYYPGVYSNIPLNRLTGIGSDAVAQVTVSPEVTTEIVRSNVGILSTSANITGIVSSQFIVFDRTISPSQFENSKVTTINIIDPGIGYTQFPSLTLSSPIISGNSIEGVGVGSTAIVSVLTGNVSNINLNSIGVITSSIPTITVSSSSGIGTTAIATVSFGVSSILVTNPGSGYRGIPVVTPTVQFPQTPLVVGVSSVIITKIFTTSSGFGYTVGELNKVVVFSSGNAAAANTNFSLPSSPLGYTIVTPGFNYTTPPNFTVSSPNVGSEVGILTSTLGISSVIITSPGFGYYVSPNISLGPNINPSLIGFAGYVAMGVSSFGLRIFGGVGYVSPPSVSFTAVGGIGTGAAANANINVGGQVDTITITNVGSGYSTPPIINFSGGGPSVSAAATIRSMLGLSYVVTNPGYGVSTVVHISFPGTTAEFIDFNSTKTGTVGFATTSVVNSVIFSSQGTLSIASTTIISGISTFATIILQRNGDLSAINATSISGIDTTSIIVGFGITGTNVQSNTLINSISSSGGGTVGLSRSMTNSEVGFGLTFFISDTLSSRIIVGQGVSGTNINPTINGTIVTAIGNSQVFISTSTLNSGIQTSVFSFGTNQTTPGSITANFISGITTSGVVVGQRVTNIGVLTTNTNVSSISNGRVNLDKFSINSSISTSSFTFSDITAISGFGLDGTALMGVGQVSVWNNASGAGYTAIPTITISGAGVGASVVVNSLGISTNCFSITNPGIYTATIPNILITPPNVGGQAPTAVVGIGVSRLSITSPGTYSGSNPTFTFSDGGNIPSIPAQAQVDTICLTGIFVANSGSGYTVGNLPIAATFSNNTLSANVGMRLESFNISNPGLGYSFAPTVTVGISSLLIGGVGAALSSSLAQFGPESSLYAGPGYGSTFVYYISPVNSNSFRLYRDAALTSPIVIGISTLGNPIGYIGGRVTGVTVTSDGSGYSVGNILGITSAGIGNTFVSYVGTGFSGTVSRVIQNYQTSDIMMLQSVGSANTSVDIAESIGISNLNDLLEFDSDLSGTTARLKATPKYNNNTVKLSRTTITI